MTEDDGDESEIMPSIKDVMDYGRMNFDQVMAMPFDLFMLMRKHAFIDRMSQSEDGRKYLRDCERLGQTKAQAEKLRTIFANAD